SLPPSSVIASAALAVYISGSASGAPVNVHRVTVPWNESDVTFASLAQHFDPNVLGAFLPTSTNAQKSVDVTPVVASWLSGAVPNDGLLLETSATKKTILVSREGGVAEQKPQLSVCYSTADDHCTPNPCLSGGTCENAATGYVCHCPAGYTGA